MELVVAGLGEITLVKMLVTGSIFNAGGTDDRTVSRAFIWFACFINAAIVVALVISHELPLD